MLEIDRLVLTRNNGKKNVSSQGYLYVCLFFCRQSKKEYEAQQRQSKKEENEYKAVLNISQVESQRLEQAAKEEQDKLSEVSILSTVV